MDFITVSPHPTGKKKILFESLSEFDVVVNVPAVKVNVLFITALSVKLNN